MSLVRFIITLAIGTLLSWATWILVISTLDPFSGGAVSLALFYVSLFLASVGTMTILGFFARYWLEREKILFQQIAIALRQAVIVGTGGVVALLLQSARLLNGVTLASLIVLMIIVEMLFLAGQSRHPRSMTQ